VRKITVKGHSLVNPLRERVKKGYSIRRDHAGLDSPPFEEVRGLTLAPFAFMMNTLELPVRVELKAMYRPSGDQAGLSWFPPPEVTL
jgi:hypothetical protein